METEQAKPQLDFVFKFIKESIMMALEETEHILTSLNKLSVTDETNLSEQDLLIMEESAQVRSKVARQLIRNLRNCKTPQPSEDYEQKDPLSSPTSATKYQVNKIHQKYLNKCRLCKARFPKASLLKYHIRTSHYRLSFVCSKCYVPFKSKQRLKHHNCGGQCEEECKEEQKENRPDNIGEQREEYHHEEDEEEEEEEMQEEEEDDQEEEQEEEQESSPLKASPSLSEQSVRSVQSSAESRMRNAHSSTSMDGSPKNRGQSASITPRTSPEDDQESDSKSREFPVGLPNISSRPQNLPFVSDISYYVKDAPEGSMTEQTRSFFQRREIPLPPLPLHRFESTFGGSLPSLSGPRSTHERPQFDNGPLSNLPSPIPTTQPLQSILGSEKGIPLLNFQKNNAFITQLLAASCIPTSNSTATTASTSTLFSPDETSPLHLFDSNKTPTGGTCSQFPTAKSPPDPLPHNGANRPIDSISSLNRFLDYKKYSCKICHRKFSQRSSLNRHVYTIHWNMKIKCAFCTKTYTQKCLLKQHVYEEHGVEACLQMFSANERINWKMQLVNSQKQRLNMANIEEEDNSMKQETSST